jgi:hypothetical protein
MRRGVAVRQVSGAVLLLLGVSGLFLTWLGGSYQVQNDVTEWYNEGLPILFCMGVSVSLLLVGKNVNSKAEEIAASITPITEQNAHLLPPQDTLLRGSDLPPTEQAELLRAVQTGQATPAEQLLRAGQGEAAR